MDLPVFWGELQPVVAITTLTPANSSSPRATLKKEMSAEMVQTILLVPQYLLNKIKLLPPPVQCPHSQRLFSEVSVVKALYLDRHLNHMTPDPLQLSPLAGGEPKGGLLAHKLVQVLHSGKLCA